MENFIPIGKDTYLVPMPRSAVTGRFITQRDRVLSDVPAAGEKEARDWHPDEHIGEPTDEDRLTFSDDEFDAIQIYINDIRDFVGLGGWDVYIATKVATADAFASIHPVYGRHVAALAVCKDWWSLSPTVQRNTIVHELLHVVHNRATEVIRTAPASNWQWRTFEREIELMVDHLAGVLDQFAPMPHTPEQIALWRANKTGPFEE